jgi:hypothetical protein
MRLMTFGPDEDTGARITSLTDYNTFLDHFQVREDMTIGSRPLIASCLLCLSSP